MGSVFSFPTFLTFLTVLTLITSCGQKEIPPSEPLSETHFYIWQQYWSPDVSSAVRRAQEQADGFWILGATLQWKGDAIREQIFQPDWKALKDSQRPVTVTVRMDGSFAKPLADRKFEAVVDKLASLLEHHRSNAQKDGAQVTGLQLDYDCPTQKLEHYVRLVRLLRVRLAGIELSVTTLPDWLSSKKFSSLVNKTDYFVLQVHSLEKPTGRDSPLKICDVSRIPGWLGNLKDIGTPFYLALPTYGYQVVYDRDGKPAGVFAESGMKIEPESGLQVRSAMAEPAEIASVVRSLRKEPPPWCRGIVWFRLPVEGDQLNWNWPALQAVMEGREPKVAFEAEVRSPNPGLYEVWLSNKGEFEPLKLVTLELDFQGQEILAYDMHNGFQENGGTNRLIGPAPPIGEPLLAAWYRLAPDEAATAKTPIAGKVEVVR